jgi:hypothetical protein
MSLSSSSGLPHVWLAYVRLPYTTAEYLKRALAGFAQVTTIGPRFPRQLVRDWRLENMKLPLGSQDIPTDFTPDLAEILRKTPRRRLPDLFLWVESVPGFAPRNLQALPCPKAAYFIDSHFESGRSLQIPWSREFDHVFLAQREYVPQFAKGSRTAHWLPLGCDPEIHSFDRVNKEHEIGFVGSIDSDPARARLLDALKTRFDVHYEKTFLKEMSGVFARSMLGFNHPVNNDLNMRFFELLSIGTAQLNALAVNSGQDELFRAGEDYILYDENNLVDVARRYLLDDTARERIAQRGQQLARAAHTYAHRAEELLKVALGGKPATPTAAEWRERSLAGIPKEQPKAGPPTFVVPSRADRSFVIPVLDFAPASQFNIRTLLKDLESIPGEVIIIFNSEKTARKIRKHRRIDLHAVMSHNVGVARSWNIGVHMASSSTVFFMNSDLKVYPEAVDALQDALWTLPEAAVVGPQGGMMDLQKFEGYGQYDHHRRPEEPVSVDAISGFFFAVKREHFMDRKLLFWDELSPCFGEEYDLAMQANAAGLKRYVIPTNAYDHEWSGTIRGLRTVKYLKDREITSLKSHHRNKRAIWKRWNVFPGLSEDTAP